MGSNPTTNLSKLTRSALRTLISAEYSQLEQLTQIKETELKQMHGIGPNALKQLRAALEAKGWSFAPDE